MPSAINIAPGTLLPTLRWDVDWAVQVNRSDWSRGRKVIGLPGQPVWLVKATTPPQATEADVRAWRSIMMQLRGPENNLRLPAATNQITGSNPTVTAINSSLQSMTLSSASQVKNGMFGTVTCASGRERMFVLTADPTGNVINIQPELPDAPTIGQTVELINPYCFVALVDPKQGWDDNNGSAVFVFDAQEAF